MTQQEVYLTPERYKEIQDEITDLKTRGRERIAERLRQAKELGDLSENFDYHQAREEQAQLEQRINQLEEMLRRSVIIKKVSSAVTARIGAKVKVKTGNNISVYTIVGSNEANPEKGLISNESPLGRGILGKKIGDVVTITTPKGKVTYEVLNIE